MNMCEPHAFVSLYKISFFFFFCLGRECIAVSRIPSGESEPRFVCSVSVRMQVAHSRDLNFREHSPRVPELGSVILSGQETMCTLAHVSLNHSNAETLFKIAFSTPILMCYAISHGYAFIILLQNFKCEPLGRPFISWLPLAISYIYHQNQIQTYLVILAPLQCNP